MSRASRLALGMLALVAVVIATTEYAASSELKIELQPGYNPVTWNGAEPYAIDNFQDTPVAQVHRWDAVRQEWLSHVIGRDGATLPELHLLPRVQYFLLARAPYELDVPAPLASIDPRAPLRFAAPPDDPLRFEAYWPNEDSPLEDLVVLRGEDERLSVKAEVAGGVGEVELYWVLDGRLNHQGLASDDVELTPGAHDGGRLFAVDNTGQVAVVELPRVVKLPPLDLPVMVYGIAAHLPRGNFLRDPGVDVHDGYTWGIVDAALEMIVEAGIELVRFDLSWKWSERSPGQLDHSLFEGYDRLLRTVAEYGLQVMPIIYNGIPEWVSGCDVSRYAHNFAVCEGRPALDANEVQQYGRTAASLFPHIRYWQVGNEPNLDSFWSGMSAEIYVAHLKAIALGIWYENPDAIIIAAGICCADGTSDAEHIEGVEFVERMYEAGFGPYHDVNGIHYPGNVHFPRFLDRYLEVMRHHGDGERALWSTEMGFPGENDMERQAHLIVEELEWLTSRPEVQAAIIYNFRDDGVLPSGLVHRRYDDGFILKPGYWAVREYLTGKPPPE